MSRRFSFDARARMAAIEARRAGSAAAVPAVLAVLKPLQPQKPQEPQPQRAELAPTRSRVSFDDDPFDADAIEERAALAADSVPACYLDAWARLQCRRPLYATEEAWRQAIDDAGRFLDAWGTDAAAIRWTAGELFDAPREGRSGGLVWQLKGERVIALGEDRARLSDGRTLEDRHDNRRKMVRKESGDGYEFAGLD